jgi:hypothetical protein
LEFLYSVFSFITNGTEGLMFVAFLICANFRNNLSLISATQSVTRFPIPYLFYSIHDMKRFLKEADLVKKVAGWTLRVCEILATEHCIKYQCCEAKAGAASSRITLAELKPQHDAVLEALSMMCNIGGLTKMPQTVTVS